MYKRKKQETASRLISTILHFNTFKDCTAYVTFPHCTAENIKESWTLLVVCTSTFIVYIHKKYLCNSQPYLSLFLDLPKKKVPILTDLIKIVLEYCILYTVPNILFSTRHIWVDGSNIYIFIYFYSNYLQYIYKPVITSAKVRQS
jgi:hypothetical protein